MIDPTWMLRLTCMGLGLWGLLNAAQWWVDRRAWRAGRALGWDLHGSRRGRLASSAMLSRGFSRHPFEMLIAIKFAASLLLLSLPISGWTPLILVLLWIASIVLALRAPADGADKIALVVIAGALLWAVGTAWTLPALVVAGTLWIGGQLTIAYATSGLAKLALPTWRDGRAFAGAMASHSHGHRVANAVASRPAAAIGAAWLVMLTEALFPLLLLAPPAFLAIGLAGFFLFHMAIAVFMGLNTYPWAFLSAYPATMIVSGLLRSATGL